jgi:hypothetical protein
LQVVAGVAQQRRPPAINVQAVEVPAVLELAAIFM